MTLRDQLHAEIDRLDERDMEEIYAKLKGLEVYRRPERSKVRDQRPLLEQLSDIRAAGPEDWAENHDLYLSGEKDG